MTTIHAFNSNVSTASSNAVSNINKLILDLQAKVESLNVANPDWSHVGSLHHIEQELIDLLVK